MDCKECGHPMTQLSPKAIYDPQPTRYIDRWRCDQKECPIQGMVWDNDEWQRQAAIDSGAMGEGGA